MHHVVSLQQGVHAADNIMAAALGQAVVVENKPGANGFLAVKQVLTAPADGYTVFIGSNSTLAVNAALFKSLPYDPVADFAPLSMAMRAPALLITPANAPYQSVAELIAAARAHSTRSSAERA